jgi:UDP-glucose 4-epimerase
MRVLVTGSHGQVGVAVVRALVGGGHEVFGADAMAAPRGGWAGGKALCGSWVGDLREPYAVHRAIDAAGWAPEAVCHLANHRNSMAGPAEMVLRENLAVNTSVILGSIERGARRIVFASSVQAALGGIEKEFGGASSVLPPRVPIDESIEPHPTNAYGLSKLTTERMMGELARMSYGGSGVSFLSLRLPFVMSDRSFDYNRRREAPSDLSWGGTEAFSYLHESDAGEAFRLACEAEGIEGSEMVWVVAPDPRPPDGVGAIVERVYGGVPGALEAVERGGFWDCAKAERLLGWRAMRVLGEARKRGGE